jgi:CheY-like chemotaxis protein
MNLLILVVDDEPDVEMLFRQQFRRDLRQGRFRMEFAPSGDMALQLITDATGISLILILSDINMPGMTGLELLPKAKAARPDVPVIMITAYGDAETSTRPWRTALTPFSPNRSISARFAARLICASRAPPNQYCVLNPSGQMCAFGAERTLPPTEK